MADPRVAAFDLNIRLEEDDNDNLALDLNEPILESGNDNGFDLNLPLDEYEQDVEVPVEVHHRRKDMTEEVTRQVYQALLARSKNETLGKKDTRIVADQFGVHTRSVQRLWKQGILRVLSMESKHDFCNTSECFEGSHKS
ncbi:uncharacterized protein [Miscanthus floridulus]|uniref:uncharacterized protein n=1 Tax=Miscanthus floridulus TaxID=154761 RepID=UPI0034582B0D